MLTRIVTLLVLVPLTTVAHAQVMALTCSPRVPCTPPATFRYTLAPSPFDAPVRFGGELQMPGGAYWIWLKDGEPSKPCTAAQIADRRTYGPACARRIGEALYVTPQFRLAAP